jgi:ABC-2 type transport system ATP-binding protein
MIKTKMEGTCRDEKSYFRDDLAIQAMSLSRKYGTQIAVDQINLNVGFGQIFGLLGPNGAGKSTTIKMLTTLLNPTSGSAIVAGFNVVTQPAKVRRRIGYVPQMVSADGALTGYENLALSAKLYRMPKSKRFTRIGEVLKFMGLEDSAKRLVKTYSGGMIRRLELAQAMLHHPAVLFLDEPTIGLDPVARRIVWDRLKDLKRDYQMTILITTHDMEEADVLCDELAILHEGQIAATGKPAELKASINPTANLDDVFIHFSGVAITEGGNYSDVRRTRNTATRLG